MLSQSCMASQVHVSNVFCCHNKESLNCSGCKKQRVICCSGYMSNAGQLETQANKSSIYMEDNQHYGRE